MAHAYLFVGGKEEGEESARAYIERELGKGAEVLALSFGLLSIEESRKLQELVYRTSTKGEPRAFIIPTSRFFYDAQNALLKVFEEPPKDTTLILIVESEGVLLPTLRSRLTLLPQSKTKAKTETSLAQEFISGSADARKKFIEKMLSDAKSDKQEVKGEARARALTFAKELSRLAYAMREKNPSAELTALLADLDHFIPILHESSAPLKPILEHISLVTPAKL